MSTTRELRACLAAGLGLGLVLAGPAWAQRAACGPGLVAATVVSVGGAVTVTGAGGALPATVGSVLCHGDRIVTGEDGTIEFRLEHADTTAGASGNTEILLPPSPPADHALTMVSGLLRFISSVRGHFEIRSPLVTAGIDGTEALVVVDGPAADTLVLVREGEVTATDRRSESQRFTVAGGEAVYASATTTLVAATPETVPDKFLPLLLRPKDAADWAVYYPPVLLGAQAGSAAVREAARLLAAGDPDAAEALLSDTALAPTDQAAALAMRAVAAVYRNRNADGLALARAAVAAAPGLGAAEVALSYALQADGRVEEARDAAARAVIASPEDAYAWARLAELELTLGAYRRAELALERSLEIRETGLARAIEGFLALAGVRLDRAEAAFTRAIALDSGAPMPRLGLGLAEVRAGRLAEGRAEIEAAVALDPRRASLRTWLGRVYFEEDRPEKAAAQFVLAEEEDPDDPTPHFFSALERFAANDPIGALGDIERAQALGARRGTQRGQAGLAEDRAARGAALGRVYGTLGFDALATATGTRAVEDDPTSPEAHFFLSDAFFGRQGFEVAQSSEFMLGQILSPPNRALPQPRLAETGLGLLQATGPTRATFAEFSPLVTGNGVSFGVSGALGTQDTFGLETSLAVLQGPVSLALGQFSSMTDGYLTNNSVSHRIYALEGRARLGPRLNLFTELRNSSSDFGDRIIEFGNRILPNERRTLDRTSVRAALHYAAAPGQDIVAIGTWSTLDDVLDDCEPAGGGSVESEIDLPQDARLVEARYFGRFGGTRATLGGSIARVDVDGFVSFRELSGPCGPGATVERTGEIPGDFTIQTGGAFGYLVSEVTPQTELTVGFAFNSYEQADYLASEADPKLGLRVQLTDRFAVRAAYAETVTRPQVLSQTIEPTTVAGFNQFYDDSPGAVSRLAGVGADARAAPNLWLGAAATRRWIDTPIFANTFGVEATRETAVSGYANMTLGDHWALAVEARHEQFRVEDKVSEVPERVDTTLVPVSARWFGTSGLFTSVDASYVHQALVMAPGAAKRHDDGFLLGGSIGYRLPNGRGMVTLAGGNLLDTDLEFRDLAYNTPWPQGPLVPRERTLALTGTFVW